MTVDEVREIALAQPDAYESEHHGHPDFRIQKGIFATIAPDFLHSVLRLPLPLAEGLAQESAGSYRVVSRAGGMGWLKVRLEDADVEAFRALMQTAWEARR